MEKDKKTDLLEKGAIVQRDYETYAVAPHLPGGICDPQTLRKIADVAEKYNAKALKLTSAQRVAIVGIPEEDIDNVWKELDLPPGHAVGLCVRSVKFCPGTTFCKRGKQDSVKLGMELDKRYHGTNTPTKFKIGVSGCTNCCGESRIKDLGFIGRPNGWEIVVGGSAAASPTIAQTLVKDLTDEAALEIADKIINYYKKSDTKLRLGKYIDKIGFDIFKEEIIGNKK